MSTVTIRLPALLAPVVNARTIELEAHRVEDALRTLTEQHPAMRQLLFDERGALREHVLCFHNGDDTRWFADGLQRTVNPGDELTIIQAVSGG